MINQCTRTVSISDSPEALQEVHIPKPHSRPTDQTSGGIVSVGSLGDDSGPSWI